MQSDTQLADNGLMGPCTWSTYNTSQSLVPAISLLAQASEAHFTDGGGEGPIKRQVKG